MHSIKWWRDIALRRLSDLADLSFLSFALSKIVSAHFLKTSIFSAALSFRMQALSSLKLTPNASVQGSRLTRRVELCGFTML
jgi:hypothetical protein